MPAAFTPPWNVQTPMRVPAVIRENASAIATAYRSSRSISIGIPSRPSALFTRQTGNVETQSTPSCLRMRAMPVATSIVMDQSSCVREQVFAVAVAFTLGHLRQLLNRDPEVRARRSVDLSAVAGLAFTRHLGCRASARGRERRREADPAAHLGDEVGAPCPCRPGG